MLNRVITQTILVAQPSYSSLIRPLSRRHSQSDAEAVKTGFLCDFKLRWPGGGGYRL